MSVYFIQADGQDGLIKIGRTVNVKRRLMDLQVGSPVPLRLVGLASGGQTLEAKLHRKHQADRRHGEWFAPTEAVRASVAEWAYEEPTRPKPRAEQPKTAQTAFNVSDVARALGVSLEHVDAKARSGEWPCRYRRSYAGKPPHLRFTPQHFSKIYDLHRAGQVAS